jgi:hypothetical protein
VAWCSLGFAAAATVLIRIAGGVGRRPRAHRRNIGVVFRQVNHCTRYGWPLVHERADAFATDDVLLYGFIAMAKNASDMKVVGEYLSYDPYGLVYRRDDPAFAAVVERTFARMASERQLADSTTSGSCAGCRPARR